MRNPTATGDHNLWFLVNYQSATSVAAPGEKSFSAPFRLAYLQRRLTVSPSLQVLFHFDFLPYSNQDFLDILIYLLFICLFIYLFIYLFIIYLFIMIYLFLFIINLLIIYLFIVYYLFIYLFIIY